MDVAQLGIKISSGEAVDAARALDGFTMAAGKADTANEKLSRGSKSAAEAKRQQAAEAKAAAAAEKAAAQAIAAAEKAQAQAAKEAAQAQALLDKSMSRTAMQSKQLSFQLNDVFTSLAGGMNPMMVAMQQGSQFSQVFNEMGSGANIVKGLGAAFMSVINPASLATLAVIGLGGALVQWMTSGSEEVQTLEDRLTALEKSMQAVNEISKTYSSDGIQDLYEKYGRVDEQVLKLIEHQKQYEIDNATLKAAEAVEGLREKYGTLLAMIDAGGKGGQVAQAQLTAELGLSANEGIRLRDALAEASDAATFRGKADALAKVADVLSESSIKASKFYNDVNHAEDAMLRLANSAPRADWMNAALAGINNLTGGIWDAVAAMGTLSHAQVQAALMSPTVTPQRGDPRTFEKDKYWTGKYFPDPEKMKDPVRVHHSGRSGKSDTERAAEKAVKDAEALAKKYDDLVTNQNQYIAHAELEAKTVGMSAVETAKLMKAQDLLNKATDAGIKLTPKQTEALTNLAVKSAEADEKVRKLTEAFDFRRDMIKGGLDDIRSALDDGKITWDEVGNIAVNALDRIIDKLMKDIPDALANLTGGGGGGILSNIFGALFGGGGGSDFFNGGDTFLGGWASGGYTGPGGKNDPAGIVHAGEFVFSSDAVRAIGLGNLEAMHGAAKRGYSSGGYVGPAPASAKAAIGLARAANSDSANGNAAPAGNTYHITVNNSTKGVEEQIVDAIRNYDRQVAPHTARNAIQQGQKYGTMR